MQDNKVRIIAELGCGHREDGFFARDFSRRCEAAGADFVKWQLYTPELLALWRDSERCRGLPALSSDVWNYVFDTIPAAKRMATVFEPRGAIDATLMGIPNLKISHAECGNFQLMQFVSQVAWRRFISTITPFPWGNATPGFHWMRTVPSYPCSRDEAMKCIDGKHPDMGYSDHTGSTLDAAKYAIEKGCKLIEIHVHPDDCNGCIDHTVSKTVSQLKELCEEAHA